MRRLYAAPGALVIPPGHEFQTAISLRNRGDVEGRIRGTAPLQRIHIELTDQGRHRVHQLVNPPAPPPAVDPFWPFPCSSRPLKPENFT